ncbi:hypothetical protein ACFQ0X_13275 [Streptomyces rectiviolaceus]|uniref:hypothetical protein n=1 Tax=Streptomyces rectiviolaceus TaxID=332591 RepID=UPI00364314BF
MPLKYEDVIEADLSPLSDVAGAWRKMGDRFGELKGEYKKHVPRALANGKWQGEAFGVQQDAAKVTSFEYAAAKKEAQAIASLLKDAHTELTRLQKVLKDLVADAEAKDYKVDGSGKATYVGFDKLTAEQWESFIHDPDRTRLEAQARERAQGWTDEIAKAVKAIDESDQSIRRALDRAVTDTSPDGGGRNGFNASAVGDLKKAGAREESATQSNGWSADRKGEVTGPYADATATGVGYGKEGMAKAWVQLAHLTGQGEVTNGNFKLSGIADLTADARAMGTYGITDTGISADGELPQVYGEWSRGVSREITRAHTQEETISLALRQRLRRQLAWRRLVLARRHLPERNSLALLVWKLAVLVLAVRSRHGRAWARRRLRAGRRMTTASGILALTQASLPPLAGVQALRSLLIRPRWSTP